MSTTKIEWSERVWNPVRGCSKVSAGCTHCYAERQAARFSAPGEYAHGFVERGRWTGKVALVESKLREPLSWRKPSLVFVNSMSDLFHEDLPDEAIDRVFAVMALCPQHTFQVLTKRPERMREYLSRREGPFRRIHASAAMDPEPWRWISEKRRAITPYNLYLQCPLPLPNVWLGTSIEDQDSADLRVGHLLATPAAIRFVSAEPLLGRVQLNPYLYAGRESLDWVIVGGESGPGSRPCDVAWIRSIVAQCKATRVPVFVKQLGANIAPCYGFAPRVVEGRWISHPKGGDPLEWPEDLRVREFPEVRA